MRKKTVVVRDKQELRYSREIFRNSEYLWLAAVDGATHTFNYRLTKIKHEKKKTAE